MTRTMYDGVSWNLIPASAQVVAGYGNGHYKWPNAAWARWPGRIHIVIDTNGSDPVHCHVLDVERYDATPAQCPAWIKARIPHGRACIYTSRSSLDAVSKACKGFKGIDVWVADWDGMPHEVEVPANMHLVAVQYQSTASYDLSAVYDAQWPLGEVK